MAELNFDASSVEPDTGFETVPAGWYNVAMDESTMKPTKDGAGAYLECRFDILDGQYKGRKLFARYNVKNANAQAVEIAYKQLSAVAHAVGVLNVQDSEQLHGIPLKLKVKIRKDRTGEYEDQNDVVSAKNINEKVETVGAGGDTGQPTAGFTPPPAAAPPAAAPVAPSAPPAPPAPPAPVAPPAPAGPQKPTDPTHIHQAGTSDEQWWIDGAWTKPPVTQAAPSAPPAPAAPTMPAQPWQAAPAPAAPSAPAAPTGAPAAPAAPETPPWVKPPTAS